MRLGGHFFSAHTLDELEPLCEKLDTYGLSAINPPWEFEEMAIADCVKYGERARELGLVIGETGMWSNLLIEDSELRAQRINSTRGMLERAEAMECLSVVTLVGSRSPSDYSLAVHPYNYTDECRREFREIVLRILDGLDLQTTRYIIEPWHNTFFYQPEDIAEFFKEVDHPAFGLHLDQMNMVSQAGFYDTTSLINRTFDLLSDYVASVHLKDIACDDSHMFLKYDEVHIGEGVLDYDTYLKRLSALAPDMPCYCEHMETEGDFAIDWATLHYLAKKNGTEFLPRTPR